MTPPVAAWVSAPFAAVTPATPFWGSGGGGSSGSLEAWDHMFAGGEPSGDSPSLERRRERRGAAVAESTASKGFVVATFSEDGSGSADATPV